MRHIFILVGLFVPFLANADTIDHYMNIYNNIPQMEMKADPQAQAWARSARHVLAITDETVAETLLQANDLAKAQGHPLFCLPNNTSLNSATLSGLIVNTYKEISSQQSDKNKMTVSQVAWLGVSKTYPCNKENDQTPGMKHVSSLLKDIGK